MMVGMMVTNASVAQSQRAQLMVRRLATSASTKTKQSSSRSSSSSSSKRHRQIMIFASEVPVIAALNRFRGIEEVFFAIWKRTNPHQVERLQKDFMPLEEEKIPIPIEPQEKLDFLLKQVGGQKCRDQVETFVQETKAQAQTIQQIQQATSEIASRLLPSKIEPTKKTEIVQLVKSQIHQNFGTVSEQVAVRQYEHQHRVVVQNRNLKFYKKQLPLQFSNHPDTKVFVGGRIDGQIGGKIVEVKNRMRQFKSPLPKYDVAQLQTYLFILDSHEGELVEFLNRQDQVDLGSELELLRLELEQTKLTSSQRSQRSKKSQSKLTKVAWDPLMWQQEILPFLGQFSYALHEFMQPSEQDAQVRFLLKNPSERKEIVRNFWGRDLPKDLWT